VLDYDVQTGNPADAEQLAPAIRRIGKRLGRVPRQVTGDRGYGEAAVEHSPDFRELVKWRTGCEGRISHLKRRYGWDRSLVDGRTRTATWCGHGILAHNLAKIARLSTQ
jgi:IS5 family transposase